MGQSEGKPEYISGKTPNADYFEYENHHLYFFLVNSAVSRMGLLETHCDTLCFPLYCLLPLAAVPIL